MTFKEIDEKLGALFDHPIISRPFGLIIFSIAVYLIYHLMPEGAKETAVIFCTYLILIFMMVMGIFFMTKKCYPLKKHEPKPKQKSDLRYGYIDEIMEELDKN